LRDSIILSHDFDLVGVCFILVLLTSIASTGQAFSHAPQYIQYFSSALTFSSISPDALGLGNERTLHGQTSIHAPQVWHSS
jgi:hypothetical protein